MIQAVIGLSLAYVALGVLLLGLTINSRWPVWVKVVSILLVSAFYFVTYLSLGGMQGWPTAESPPERFLLLASSIHEPDKTTGSKGLIYIWATSLAEDRPAAEPRAYQLDYSSELHSQLDEANKNIRDGILQLGKIEWVIEAENSRDIGRFAQHQKTIRFYEVPDPEMPEK